MDYTKTAKALLMELFNTANPGMNMPEAAATLGAPGVNAGSDSATRNTALTLTAVGGSGYTGSLGLTYNRLHIDTGVVSTGSATFAKTSGLVTISDVVALLNTRFSINLVKDEDYTDGSLPTFTGDVPDESHTFTLTILADSLVYRGSVVITLTAGDVDLTSQNGQLDGFTYP
jgi:hypothetical protein